MFMIDSKANREITDSSHRPTCLDRHAVVEELAVIEATRLTPHPAQAVVASE